jgi:hypothetical protein
MCVAVMIAATDEDAENTDGPLIASISPDDLFNVCGRAFDCGLDADRESVACNDCSSQTRR